MRVCARFHVTYFPQVFLPRAPSGNLCSSSTSRLRADSRAEGKLKTSVIVQSQQRATKAYSVCTTRYRLLVSGAVIGHHFGLSVPEMTLCLILKKEKKKEKKETKRIGQCFFVSRFALVELRWKAERPRFDSASARFCLCKL